MKTPLYLPAPARLNFLVIARDSIEGRDTAGPLQRLDGLICNREVALRNRGTLSLVVDGYSGDRRLLYEIPEIREFFSTLDRAFPYWFFVANKVDETLGLLAAMLCESMEMAPGVVNYEAESFRQFLERHFSLNNWLFKRLGLNESLNDILTEEIAEYFMTGVVENDVEAYGARRGV